MAWRPTPELLPGESSWTEEPGGLQPMGLQSQTRLSDEAERACGESKPFYTAGGNVNWYSHCGGQYGQSLKESYHMIQQSHCWAHIQRKP